MRSGYKAQVPSSELKVLRSKAKDPRSYSPFTTLLSPQMFFQPTTIHNHQQSPLKRSPGSRLIDYPLLYPTPFAPTAIASSTALPASSERRKISTKSICSPTLDKDGYAVSPKTSVSLGF